MNYQNLAKNILKNVGGKENVNGLVHCATRLRFNLKDDAKANEQNLKDLQGVVGVVNKGGQYQVIVGNEVKEVYAELNKLGSFSEGTAYEKQENKGIISKVLDTIAGIFVPIVPALTGAGMLKALLALLGMLGWLSAETQTYQILNFIGDAAFYFLPVLLASSAAKKFNCNQYIAMTIGGILLHPTFSTMIAGAREAGTGLSLFGLPVTLANYGSSVIPIILAVWFMSYIEPIAEKVMPKSIRLFMAPLTTLIIVAPVTLIAIGPLGTLLGTGLGNFIGFVNQYASWLVPTLVGTFTPLLVMTGMHYGLIPIGINLLATTGFDTVAGPGMMVSNIAQGGAALAVSFKTKDLSIRQLSISTGISAVAGITEPALYGVNLRFKRPLIAAMIGGGAAGLFIGIMNVGRYAQVAPGIFALPSFFGEKGFSNFLYAVIGCVIAFVVAFIAELFLGIEEEGSVLSNDSNVNSAVVKEEKLVAPINGQVITLSEVSDPAFASESLGKGVGIIPLDGKIYSPVDGKISAVFDSKHAIGIESDQGAEILIHVGIDTVTLNGEGFTSHITRGQKVKKGDLLLEVDLAKIAEKQLDSVILMVVTNSSNYQMITVGSQGDVSAGEELLLLD